MGLITDSLENMVYVHLDGDITLLEDQITKISDRLDDIQAQYIDTTSIVWVDSTTAVWAECDDILDATCLVFVDSATCHQLIIDMVSGIENILPDLSKAEQQTPELQAKYDEYLVEFQNQLRDNRLFRFAIYMKLLGFEEEIKNIPIERVPEHLWHEISFSVFEENLRNLDYFPKTFLRELKPYIMQKVEEEVDSLMEDNYEMQIAMELYELQNLTNTTLGDKIPLLTSKTETYKEAGFVHAEYFEDRLDNILAFLPFDENSHLDFEQIIDEYNLPEYVKVNIKMCLEVAGSVAARMQAISSTF